MPPLGMPCLIYHNIAHTTYEVYKFLRPRFSPHNLFMLGLLACTSNTKRILFMVLFRTSVFGVFYFPCYPWLKLMRAAGSYTGAELFTTAEHDPTAERLL